MNEESFLAAIAADPTDETTKLVFADWLEEQGDPRGAWIRSEPIRPWMGPTLQNPIPALIESLTKGRRVVAVRYACAAIGEPIVPALVELLGHEKPLAREQAAICLRKIGKRARSAVPALLAALKDSDSQVRDAVAKALKDIKPASDAATEQLRDALNDESHTVRQVASQVLGSMRATTGVAQDLTDRLDSQNPEERKAAIKALATLRTPEVVAPLCRGLQDADPTVRRAAAEQFGQQRQVPTDEALEPLRVALSDPIPVVRALAAIALGRCEQRAASAIRDLIRNVAHADAEVRSAAIRALGNVGPEDPAALAVLVPAIEDADESVATSAVEALGKWSRLPNEVAGPLLRYRRRPRAADSWRLQPAAAYRPLSKLESPGPEVIGELLEALRSEDYHDAEQACEALGAIGPPAAAAIPDLVQAVRPCPIVYSAVRALLRIGGEGLTRLNQFLASSDRWQTVLAAFECFGAEAMPLLPAMRARLRTTSTEDSEALLVRAIQRLGPGATDAIPDLLNFVEARIRSERPSLYPALEVLAGHAERLAPHLPRLVALWARPNLNWSCRGLIGQILTRLAREVPAALDSLREILRGALSGGVDESLQHGKDYFLQTVLDGLAVLGPAAAPAIPELLPLLEDPSWGVQEQAAQTLAATRDPVVIPHFCRLADQATGRIRGTVASVLGSLGDRSEATVDALASIARDRNPRIRREAIDALGRLKANTEAALEALRQAQKDPDKGVRTRATAALKAIEGRKTRRK